MSENEISKMQSLLGIRDEFLYRLTERPRLINERRKNSYDYRDVRNPLISVCIPTYNRAELLIDRALTSVLKQTYTNFEVIVTGDHCTDNTAELIEALNDPRVHFHNLTERKKTYPANARFHWYAGGANACNESLRRARGVWIARIDDDDIWTEDHLEVLLDFAVARDVEFVSGCYEAVRFDERTVICGNEAYGSYFGKLKSHQADQGPKIGGVSTWLYRSYLRFMKYNEFCWRKRWNKVWDVDLAARFIDAGVTMAHLPRVVSKIIPRPGENTIGLDAYVANAQLIEADLKRKEG